VEQERLKKLEAMERKQKELDDAKRDEERILREAHKRRQNEVGFSSSSATPPPPPLPAVPPPEMSPTGQPTPSGAAQRLDMLVGGSNKKSETPTKKVSFLNEEDEQRRYDANANDVNDEKLSRLERVEKDPNVS
jgi:hypothetical protein